MCHTTDTLPSAGYGAPRLARCGLAAALAVAALWLLPAPLGAQGAFRRGDCDQNDLLQLTDGIFVLRFLFVGGATPRCLDACDSNDTESLELTDGVYVFLFLFRGGNEPPPPFAIEDVDPAGTALDCQNGKDPPAAMHGLPRLFLFHRTGETRTWIVLAVDGEGETRDLRGDPNTVFSTDDPRVAEVESDGTVTARGVGRTTLRARYRGVYATSEVEVLPGADGSPVVRITSPPAGGVLTSGEARLAGLVSDPEAELTLSGGPLGPRPLASEAGRFFAQVPLDPGANTFTVEARGTGGTGSAAVTVLRVSPGDPGAIGPDGDPLPLVPVPRIDPPDTTPPRVEIASPAPGAVLRSSTTDVTGTVDDPAAEVRVNGVLARTEGGAFTAARLRLAPGDNQIVARAVDPVGNAGEARRSVRVDPTRPRVAFTTPFQDGLLVAGPGVVTLTGSLDPPGAEVIVNGAAARVIAGSFSADLALAPGFHDLVATATAAGLRGQTVRSLLVDAEPPGVEILHPPPVVLASAGGFRVASASVVLLGRVFDPGVPAERLETLRLAVTSGPDLLVKDGPFRIEVPLAPGRNDLELTAEDPRGNRRAIPLHLVRGGGLEPILEAVSGDGQEVVAGEVLGAPLVVRALDELSRPQESVTVTFRAAAGSGTFTGGGREIQVRTDAQGLAQVGFRTGLEAGPARQVVVASRSGGASASVAFAATTTLRPERVLAARGPREVTGAAGEALIEPLAVRLLDGAGNPVAGEEVGFRVVQGAARLEGLAQTLRVSDLAGVARVLASLPPGDSESTIEAAAAGAEPVLFRLRGAEPGAAADTELEGMVLDDRSRPAAGLAVRIVEAGLETAADAAGRFRFQGVPAGEVLLEVDGVPELAGTRRKVTVLAGRVNVPAALRVLRVDPEPWSRELRVGPETGGVLTPPALAGFRLDVAPGAATFAGGGGAGVLQAVRPNLRASPLVPDDMAPEFILALLPLGARFSPPAPLILPNPGFAPGLELRLFAYRPGAGRYLDCGPAAVSGDDGAVSAAGVPGGGLYFAGFPGPAAGRTGTLQGRLERVLPGLHEAPQRPESAVVGSNVLAHSGEFFLDEVDLEIPGRGLHYRFRRRYESRHNFRGSLGWNWEHEYADRRLIALGAGRNVVRAAGAGRFDEYYHDAATGTYVSPPGVFSRLFADGEGFLVERQPDGTRYRYHPLDGSALAGRLESVRDRNGNRLAMARDAEGRLEEVRDPLGRAVTYGYDGEGRIAQVTDFTGRTVSFEYDARGDLVAVTSPAVTGTPSGNDFPQGKRREYAYSSGFEDERLNHNLLQAIAPRQVEAGTRIPWLTNHYREDPQAPDADRIVAQDWGGTDGSGVAAGGTVTVEYFDLAPRARGEPVRDEAFEEYLLGEAGLTRATDRTGAVTEVRWGGAGLPLSRRVLTRDDGRPRDPYSLHPPPGVVPPWYETRWRWSADGLLLAQEMPRGDRFEYVHDQDSPLRYARANRIAELHYPPPGPDGEDGVPEVTRRVFDPLFARVVAFSPPRLGLDGDERFTTRWLLDYQEGTSLETLSLEAGVAGEDLEAALERAGVELGLGDLNGDGQTLGRGGNGVVEILPPVTLPEGSIEEGRRSYTYNLFGQLTSCRDAAGVVRRWEYYPETDPDGDGEPSPGGKLDPSTGGYLKREVVDTEGAGGEPPLALARSYVYDPVGSLRRVTDPRGQAVFLEHNQLGQLVEYRLPPPLDYRRWFLYDADDHLAEVWIENFESNDSGLSLAVIENRWLETVIEYDLLGQPVTVNREVSGGEAGPARSASTQIRYDGEGRRVRVIHPDGAGEESWTYDERGLVTSHALGAGTAEASTRRFFPDENGRLVLEVSAADADGDGDPEVVEYRHDGWGRLEAVVDGAGGVRVFERDARGLVAAESFLGTPGGPTPEDREGSGNVLLERTVTSYDERGRLVEIRRHLFGQEPGAEGEGSTELVETRTHDPEGRVTRIVLPGGREVERSYDAAGRLAGESDGRGGRVTYRLDAGGNVLLEEREWLSEAPLDPGAAGDPDYDGEGRLRVRSRVVRVYDPLGRVTLLAGNAGHTWRVRYNSRDQVIFLSDAVGPRIGAAADEELAPVRSLLSAAQAAGINGHGNITRYRYDNLGRLVELVRELRRDGDGGGPIDLTNPYNLDGLITESFEWDGADRLVAWTDDGGRRTELAYDAAGFPRRKTWAGGTSATFEVDRDGRLVGLTDPNGSQVIQRFDALGRLVARVITRSPDASGDGQPVAGTALQLFEYDGLGRLTLALDGGDPDDPGDDAVLLRGHDSLGRLAREWQGPFGFSYQRDLEGRAVATRYPDGRFVETPRGPSGEAVELRDDFRRYAAYRRLSSGLLLEKTALGGWRSSHLEADPGGVLRLVHHDLTLEVLAERYVSGGGDLLVGLEYGRDRGGSLLFARHLERGGVGEVWRYDSAYRVRRFLPDVFDPRVPPANPVRKLEFEADGNHNWRHVAVDQSDRVLRVGPRNQYTEDRGEPLLYDRNGNLIAAGARRYVYDALDRLVRVEEEGEVIARHGYDALGAQDPWSFRGSGRRAWKEVLRPVRNQPAGTVRYTWVEEGLAEERTGDGSLRRQYLWESRGRPAALLDLTEGAGAPVTYLHDATGSIAGLVSDTGALEETVRYGLHGEVTVVNTFGNAVSFSRRGNALYFGALPWDFESGLHSTSGRCFLPDLGRFLTDAAPLVPRGPLGLNGYLHPGFEPLPGEVAGGGAPLLERPEVRALAPPWPVGPLGRLAVRPAVDAVRPLASLELSVGGGEAARPAALRGRGARAAVVSLAREVVTCAS